MTLMTTCRFKQTAAGKGDPLRFIIVILDLLVVESDAAPQLNFSDGTAAPWSAAAP